MILVEFYDDTRPVVEGTVISSDLHTGREGLELF